MSHDRNMAMPGTPKSPFSGIPLRTKSSRVSVNSQVSTASKRSTTRKIIDVFTPRLRHSQSMPLEPPASAQSHLVRSSIRGKVISAPLTATAVDTARGRYLHSSRASRSSLDSVYTTRSVAQSLSSTLSTYDSFTEGTTEAFPELASPSSESEDSSSITLVTPVTPRVTDIFEPRAPSPDIYAPITLSTSIAEDIFEPRLSETQGLGSDNFLDEDPFRFSAFMSDWPVKHRVSRRTTSLDGGARPLLPVTRREVMIFRPADPLERNGLLGQAPGRSSTGNVRQLRLPSGADGYRNIKQSKSTVLLRPLSPVLEEDGGRRRMLYPYRDAVDKHGITERLEESHNHPVMH